MRTRTGRGRTRRKRKRLGTRNENKNWEREDKKKEKKTRNKKWEQELGEGVQEEREKGQEREQLLEKKRNEFWGWLEAWWEGLNTWTIRVHVERRVIFRGTGNYWNRTYYRSKKPDRTRDSKFLSPSFSILSFSFLSLFLLVPKEKKELVFQTWKQNSK